MFYTENLWTIASENDCEKVVYKIHPSTKKQKNPKNSILLKYQHYFNSMEKFEDEMYVLHDVRLYDNSWSKWVKERLD